MSETLIRLVLGKVGFFIICKMIVAIIKRFLYTDEIFEFNLRFLFLVGLWPDEDVSRTKSRLYKLYVYTLNLLMIVYFITSGINTARTDDILDFFSDIDFGLCSYNYFFKVIYFVIGRKKLKFLVDDITRYGDKVTDESKDNMIKLLVTITSLTIFISILFTLSSVYNYKLCIDMWLPFDPYKNRMNFLTALQILTIGYPMPFLFRAIGMQGMVCSLLIYMIDQLKDLQRRIRRLSIKPDELEMREELKSIIRKHIRLMRYSNSLKNIFKEYFLVQNLAVTLELCINAVLVTTVALDQPSIIFGFFVYLAAALFNAFIYCYLGGHLIEESQDIAQAAYDSDWTSWPVDLQKNMLLIITIAQKPFELTAGGMAVVNMQSYGTAIYNGYSIFAVLNDMVD